MIILFFSIIYTVQLILPQCNGLQFIDLPLSPEAYYKPKKKLEFRAQRMYEPYPRIKRMRSYHRRSWLDNDKLHKNINFKTPRRTYEDEKDATLKQKIAMLVEQTMNEAEDKMKVVTRLKDKYRSEKDYRVGFVISLIKKSREVLNELFNVAVTHRDEWLALEQLKIFELIVHTNVDTTNFLRQLAEIEAGHETFEIPDSFKISRPKKPTDPGESPDPDSVPTDPKDPNSVPLDPGSVPTDPKDPDSVPLDPDGVPTDPKDPNNVPLDPDSVPTDPKNPDPPEPAPSLDPNEAPPEANNPPLDPNEAPPEIINPPLDPNKPANELQL